MYTDNNMIRGDSMGPSINYVVNQGGRGGFPIDDVCRRKGEGGSRQNDDVVKTFNFREN